MIKIEIATKDPAQFIKQYNKARLANKNKWIFFSGTFDGTMLEIKTFNTTNQILKVNGIKQNTGIDLTVREWKYEIGQALSRDVRSQTLERPKYNPNDTRHYIEIDNQSYLVELEVSDTANPNNLTSLDISILEIYNYNDSDGDSIFDEFCAYKMEDMRKAFARDFNNTRAESILTSAEL